MIKETKKQVMVRYIQKHHEGQVRLSNQLPYWRHCVNTSEILESALKRKLEVTRHNQENMILAALGHDLYEDTEAKKEEVIELFGQQVHDYILLLTNQNNQNGQINDYVEQLLNAPEEVILIKLCDVIDNTIDTAYSIHELDYDWIRLTFIPHIQKIYSKLMKYIPNKYPKTYVSLTELMDFAFERLVNNFKKCSSPNEHKTKPLII